MSVRIYLINRAGDGLTQQTAFRPAITSPITRMLCYTVGTKFIVATPDDLTADGTEITIATAIKAAATLYGITPDMLGRQPDGSPSVVATAPQFVALFSAPTAPAAPAKTPFWQAVKQWLVLAAHAPVALFHRVKAAL